MNAQICLRDVTEDTLLAEIFPDGHSLTAGELVLVVTKAAKILTSCANLFFTVGVASQNPSIALVQEESNYLVQWGLRSWVCCEVRDGQIIWGEVCSGDWHMSYSAFERVLSDRPNWIIRSIGQLCDRPTIEVGEELVLHWLSKALLQRDEWDLPGQVMERLGYVPRLP